MKKLIFSILILGALIFSSSCERDPKVFPGALKPTEQPDPLRDFDVRFLFEVDGIRVYRFNDHGTEVYFTNVNGTTEYITSHYHPQTKHSETEYHQCTCTATLDDEPNPKENAGQKD